MTDIPQHKSFMIKIIIKFSSLHLDNVEMARTRN